MPTPNFAINLALINMGANNLNNPDEKGEILYAMGQTVSDPNFSPIEYKQHYFHCKTKFNVIRANTQKTKSPENSMQYSQTEYTITCYYSGDVGGIDRNEVKAGDYIKLDNDLNIWYKVNKLMETMGGKQYCVVRAIQTSQDPELPNINTDLENRVNSGIDTDHLLFGDLIE